LSQTPDAIARAVTEYERLREQTLVDRGTERMGALVWASGSPTATKPFT
jgi:hypothetical protein